MSLQRLFLVMRRYDKNPNRMKKKEVLFIRDKDLYKVCAGG